jgi:hypothetical protein
MKNLYKTIKKLDLGIVYNYVMSNNTGNINPYHNNFHLESVAKTALELCEKYYGNDTGIKKLPINDDVIRLVITAALFHDMNHTGSGKDDSINITIAKNCFYDFVLSNPDMFSASETFIIYDLIDATLYPYIIDNNNLNLLQKIIRDSDILQGMLCQNYIQGVVRALSLEIGISFEQMISGQESFLRNTIFALDYSNAKKTVIIENIINNVNLIKEFQNG